VSNWHVAPALDALRDEVDAVWPDRDRSADGAVGDTDHQARPSDHNPDWSAGGVVRARDITTADIDAQRVILAVLADERTEYVIHKLPGLPSRIWSRIRGFAPKVYLGDNKHAHHLHVSIRKGARYENDTRPWGIARSVAPQPTREWDEMASKAEVQEAVAEAIAQAGIPAKVWGHGLTYGDDTVAAGARLAGVDGGHLPDVKRAIAGLPGAVAAGVWQFKVKHPVDGQPVTIGNVVRRVAAELIKTVQR